MAGSLAGKVALVTGASSGIGAAAAIALAKAGATVAMSARRQDRLAELVAQVAATARAGDHVLVMSNGGFGGVHGRLLDALAVRGAATTAGAVA